VSSATAFTGGLTAAFGPEMLLAYYAIACGAAVAGSRQVAWRAHAVGAVVFAVAVGAVWVRADLVPPARFSHWLALVPVLGLAEIRRIRMGWEDWMAPAIALCTAGLVLFWRADRYGPVLATLRGDWQESLQLAPRWLYHLGTALVLGLVLFGFGLVATRLPARVRTPVAWGLLGIGLVMVIFDLVAPAQRWLLLHGPPIRVG
jgi:hypothetical protein